MTNKLNILKAVASACDTTGVMQDNIAKLATDLMSQTQQDALRDIAAGVLDIVVLLTVITNIALSKD